MNNDDKVSIVFVHGHIANEIGDQIQELIGEYSYTECYQEGGYMLTLATSTKEPLPIEQADDIIGCLYHNEESIEDVSTADDPVFAGVQPEPYRLDLKGYTGKERDVESWGIYFVAGFNGYDEDGITKYS